MAEGASTRFCHWLSHNKTSKRPDAILFIDAESEITDVDERTEHHSFRLAVGCLCTYNNIEGLIENEWRDFASESELWTWVDELGSQHKQLLIVSHNIGYDARVCKAFSSLPRLGWSPTYCIMGESCTLFVFEHDNHKITLTDNMNLWQCSLAELGQSVGLPKLSVDFATVTDSELLVYCRRDVEILVRVWQEWLAFLDKHNLGSFGITAAKQAFNAYRHRFMPVKIGIHNNATAHGLERTSYRGGRAECFFVGKAPKATYYKLDVNGLYAAMMRDNMMPRKLRNVIEGVSVDFLAHLLDRNLVIAEVVVEARTPVYVQRIDNTNTYPTGTFAVTLTTPELKWAMAHNEIRAIGRVALYEPANLFSKFIGFFTPLRQHYKAQGDTARSQMCKLLRNSLQGKFGQLGYRQEVICDAPLDEVSIRMMYDVDDHQKYQDITFGGKVLRQYNTGESWDSFPAIPAHVAAYGRMYMWTLIEMAGREHVYYIDTDSLFVDEVGYQNLSSMIDSQKLGYLKVEGITDTLVVRAKKDYDFGATKVMKGIKDDAVEVKPGTFRQSHFAGIRSAFESHNLDGVQVYEVQKTLRYGMVTGTVGQDGRVTPPHLVLRPKDLPECMLDRETSIRWTWEIDPSWLQRVSALEQLRARLTREPRFRPRHEPRHQPLTPQPEPLAASSLAPVALA